MSVINKITYDTPTTNNISDLYFPKKIATLNDLYDFINIYSKSDNIYICNPSLTPSNSISVSSGNSNTINITSNHIYQITLTGGYDQNNGITYYAYLYAYNSNTSSYELIYKQGNGSISIYYFIPDTSNFTQFKISVDSCPYTITSHIYEFPCEILEKIPPLTNKLIIHDFSTYKSPLIDLYSKNASYTTYANKTISPIAVIK